MSKTCAICGGELDGWNTINGEAHAEAGTCSVYRGRRIKQLERELAQARVSHDAEVERLKELVNKMTDESVSRDFSHLDTLLTERDSTISRLRETVQVCIDAIDEHDKAHMKHTVLMNAQTIARAALAAKTEDGR